MTTIDMELIQRLTGIRATPAEQAALFEELSAQLVNGERLEGDQKQQALLAAICHGLAVLGRAVATADQAYAAGLRDGKKAAEAGIRMSCEHDPRQTVRLLLGNGEDRA